MKRKFTAERIQAMTEAGEQTPWRERQALDISTGGHILPNTAPRRLPAGPYLPRTVPQKTRQQGHTSEKRERQRQAVRLMQETS